MTSLRVVLTLALAGTFAWSAAVKVARPDHWTGDVRRYRLGQTLKRVSVLTVPWAEVGVMLLLVAGRTAAGGALALTLLAAFSVAIVRLQRILDSKSVPCGCLGGDNARDYRLLLARNAALAAAAVALWASGAPDRGWRASNGAMFAVGAVWLVAAVAWGIAYTAAVQRAHRDAALAGTRR